MYHIRQMDRIYAGALLTIVADCGLDASSGLVGAKSGSRLPHQEVLAIFDFAMVSGVTNLKSRLKYSPWNVRGWTLQVSLPPSEDSLVDNTNVHTHWRQKNLSSAIQRWHRTTAIETSGFRVTYSIPSPASSRPWRLTMTRSFYLDYRNRILTGRSSGPRAAPEEYLNTGQGFHLGHDIRGPN